MVGNKQTDITSMFNATYTVPEPTTATLSLLALAGLAARRRRKSEIRVLILKKLLSSFRGTAAFFVFARRHNRL